MKKIVFSLALVSFGLLAQAQYKDLEKAYLLKRYEDAKKEIDKLSADPKTKDRKETYMWKANIYGQLFADPALVAKYNDAGFEAYNALNQYRGGDTSTAWAKDNLGLLDALYGTFWKLGVNSFNAQKWDSAFTYFVIAEDMGDVISRGGFTTTPQKVDTIRAFFAGAAAQNSGKKPEAVKYYKKLADEKVSDADYLDLYKYLLIYYMDKKEETAFNHYLQIASELYPKNKSVWSEFKYQYIADNLSPEEMMTRYKKEDAANQLKQEDYAGYGQALGNTIKSNNQDIDSTTLAEMKRLSADAFKKSFATSGNGIDAFNAAIMYYNEWAALDDKYFASRGATPALKAKREAIEKDQHVVADVALEWMKKAYDALKQKQDRVRVETQTLNRSIDFLANLYLWKRDKSKGKSPKDYDTYDAKYKLFDSEHGKYKD